MTSTYMCGFSNRNRSLVFTPMGFRPCFCSSGRSRTRSRRSMVGGNSSRPCIAPGGPCPRLQTLEQFPIARFVRLVLGGDNLLLFRAGRRAGLVAEVQVLLIGRLAAALASPSPEHVHQPVVGGFQFRHPLAKRVPLLGDDPRGVDQSLVIAAKSPELFQNAVQGCTQRHQFAAERFVALLALTQLFQQRVIHDAFIIAASRKTSRAKGSRTDAIFASVPELMRQRLGKSQMPYPAVAW